LTSLMRSRDWPLGCQIEPLRLCSQFLLVIELNSVEDSFFSLETSADDIRDCQFFDVYLPSPRRKLPLSALNSKNFS
jgi:hypothetical protein